MTDILKEQLSRLIRYAFPGFLFLLMYSLSDLTNFKDLVENIGVPMLSIFSLVLGAFIYVVYRLILGELILFPVVNIIHDFLHLKFKFPQGITSWIGTEHDIPFFQRRNAYHYLRQRLKDKAQIKDLEFIHTELHILYITAIIIISFFIHSYSWVGLIIMLAAAIADIKAHIRERQYFDTVLDANLITKLLSEGGFNKNAEQDAAPNL